MWRCDTCSRSTCEHCVPAGDHLRWYGGPPKCPVCHQTLVFLGSAVIAPSLPASIVRCLVYPLNSNALVVLLLASFLFTPAIYFFQHAIVGLFVTFSLIVLTTLTLDYCATLMNSMAKNAKQPLQSGLLVLGLDVSFVVQHAVVVLGLFFMASQAWTSWGVMGLVCAPIFIALLPAALMILARDRQIIAALNPGTLMLVARSLGKDYLLICFLSMALVLFFSTHAGLLARDNFSFLTAFAYVLALIYSAFFMYSLFGYALFYYQDSLGMRTHDDDASKAMTKEEFQKKRVLGESGVLLVAKEPQMARSLLQSAFETHKHDLDLHLRYQSVLLKLDDLGALRNHTNYLLGLLFDAEMPAKAAGIYLGAQPRWEDGKITDANVCFRLALQLRAEQKIKQSIALLKSFHQRYPNSPCIVPAYQLAADILATDLNDAPRAKALLQFLQQHEGSN